MNDKTYIKILEEYIYSEGHTKADLMAFVVNHINEPSPLVRKDVDATHLKKRRTRKLKR